MKGLSQGMAAFAGRYSRRAVEGEPIGITLNQVEMELTLERAISLARSGDPSPVWSARVNRLADLGVRTYIAALGGALLARATDPRVDTLAQDVRAGPRGYSLRVATEFLAAKNRGRYHLGAQGKNPLNNRPFLGGPSRIDAFEKIHPKARPAYEEFVDALRDLNGHTKEEATKALAAFLRERMAAARAEQEAARQALTLDVDLDADQLLGLCERFVRDRPEGGRKAQAFVAALLDAVFEDVVLQPINNPNPADVRVRREDRLVLAVEVKQARTTEDTALALARAAHQLGATAALLVVLADDHAPLDRERVRRSALRDSGVVVEISESVRELVGAVCVFSGGRTAEVVSRLPGGFALRMREHEVSQDAQDEWRALFQARGRPTGPR